MSKAIGVSLFALLVASSAQAQQIGDVFYIALENHNFTQPSSVTGINQIFGNSAAPFINSLVTPGNPNAANDFLRQQLSERLAGPSSVGAQLRLAGVGHSRAAQRQRPLSEQHRQRSQPERATGGETAPDLAVVSGGHRPCEHERQQRQRHHGAGDSARPARLRRRTSMNVPLTSLLRHVGQLHQPLQRQPPIQLCGQA